MGCTNSQDIHRPEPDDEFKRQGILDVTAAQFPQPNSASEKLRIGILCDNIAMIAEATSSYL